MSDVRFERVLFYYAWQDAYHQLQYDTYVKKKEEKGEKVTQYCVGVSKKKKNIIEFREGLHVQKIIRPIRLPRN